MGSRSSLVLTACFTLALAAWSARPAELLGQSVSDDPLVRMPGTQPNQVTLEAPNRCLNCHGGYNSEVEPGFNWKGSMMAQSARDFLFWSCLTVAAQDSIWAIGTPNAVDLCERCHFPKGWLEGRSDPPNASLMTGADYDGVQCDFCHTMYDPFFEDTFEGVREGNEGVISWAAYWDETNASSTPSEPAAAATHSEDSSQAQAVLKFDGSSFFVASHPPGGYTEAASGQFFVSSGSQKRASFADAAARHQMLYSRYHKSKYFCGTCHDVSNPVLANLGASPAGGLPTELNSAFSYYHVERTFSEFMLSDYGQPGGAPGLGPFAPSVFDTSLANNYIGRCQDCHMRDVVGQGCNKNGVPIRPNDSTEHPRSGQPLHDLTGGNAWVSAVLASAVPGSPNHDPVNDSLLHQGPAVLTLDLSQGEGVDPVALLAGSERAKQQLQLAASIQNVTFSGGNLHFRIQNQTGHRLISGFPEGRRMFVNVKAYQGGNLVYEINPYDHDAGTLKGLDYEYPAGSGLAGPQPLSSSEAHEDELVYEMHPKSSLTGEEETFHFVLGDGRYKDNRIPPKGFRIAEASLRQSIPVEHGVENPAYFTSAEYAGGYDEVSVDIPVAADGVQIELYYQTTSREYIEFLRDEINGTRPTLPWNPATDPNPYIAQTDSFFSQLAAWGDTIWQLWTHNKHLPGAAPFLMASASVGDVPQPCSSPTPTLDSAVPGSSQVTLSWSDEGVESYNIYYDQAGKAQFIDATTGTSYVDTGLTNGQEYCYKVTAVTSGCESSYSDIQCAIPNPPGQLRSGVTQMITGRYEKSGKGKGATVQFVATGQFTAGETVVVRATVVDKDTGLPLANATVTMDVSGPETLSLTSGPSDSSGIAEAQWGTKAPGKRGQPGTTPGAYAATVSGVTASGYTWDGVGTQVGFTIQ